ncbi:MAG: 30S ribosomal protein S4 [bacterium]
MVKNSKCKICRRLGVKLFLKSEKCLSSKCPMIKKPYPPGPKGTKRRRSLSEYGAELKEKQKLRNWYNLEERQFRKYVKETLGARRKVEDTASLLIKTLESRFDNVVFRLGFAPSRFAARQMISHRHLLVKGRPINISSYLVKKGDIIKVSEKSVKKNLFRNLPSILKKHKSPSWLQLNIEKLEGKVTGEPSLDEALPPAEISSIFEYYSR